MKRGDLKRSKIYQIVIAKGIVPCGLRLNAG